MGSQSHNIRRSRLRADDGSTPCTFLRRCRCLLTFALQVNTEPFIQATKGTLHTDGAWPNEVKTTDFADRQRLIRRIKNEPGYQSAIVNLARVADQVIQQNNTIDLYEEYFEGLEDDIITYSPPSCRTVAVFRDPNETRRAVNSLSWHPEGPHKLAVSHCIMQFQKMPANMPVSSYIWDLHNPNQPDSELIPPSPLTCLVYNPRSPDQLVGGCYNGLVGFWDLRKGNQPVETSLIEQSHRDPVYEVSWVQSRAGNECCSISTDGQVLWWDVRKLGNGPMDNMSLAAEDMSFGATTLEYRSDAGATRYLVGTEQGAILLCDRKAKKDSDSQKVVKTTFGWKHGGHFGPVTALQRNPLHPKYFMSVGDWTTKIWFEDLKQPIMSTRFDNSYLVTGCWSPTRAGVFFTTKMDGTLDVWDIFHKHNEPTFSTKVSESPLTAIRVQQQGKYVALGTADGTTTVLEISDALSDPQREEKSAVGQMFERETKREKNLEMRAIQRKRDAREQKKRDTESQQETSRKSHWDLDADPDVATIHKEIEDQFMMLMNNKEEDPRNSADAEAESKEPAPIDEESQP